MSAVKTTNAAIICAVLLVIAVSQTAQAQTPEELTAQYKSALQVCQNRFPTVSPENIVAKMSCANRAQAIVLPNLGNNGDLLKAFIAYRAVVAERIQNKKMTMAEGFAAVTQRS